MTILSDFERRLAQAARSLAQHKIAWARERRPEDQKAVASAEMEICRIYREEKECSQQR